MNADDVYVLWGMIWGVCSLLVFIYGFSNNDKDSDRAGLVYRIFISIPGGLIFVVIIAMLKLAFIYPMSL